MPGLRRGWQFDFPNGTPWPLKGLFAMLFANFVCSFGVTLWAEHYAQRQTQSNFSIPDSLQRWPCRICSVLVGRVRAVELLAALRRSRAYWGYVLVVPENRTGRACLRQAPHLL